MSACLPRSLPACYRTGRAHGQWLGLFQALPCSPGPGTSSSVDLSGQPDPHRLPGACDLPARCSLTDGASEWQLERSQCSLPLVHFSCVTSEFLFSLFLCMHISCWRDLVNWAGTYCNHMLEMVLRFNWNHFGYRIIEQDLFCKGASPEAASWIRWSWFSIGIFLPASRGSFLRG